MRMRPAPSIRHMTNHPSPSTTPTHYEVLGLPSTHSAASQLTHANIKLAYHNALLVHHPDKASPVPRKSQYTVDEIRHAYLVLSDGATRAAYERSLLTSLREPSKLNGGIEPTGEMLDLEELSYDENEAIWYRSCRCGQERGFILSEGDLERAVEEGEKEVVTGCTGCSLWIRVLFGVVDAG